MAPEKLALMAQLEADHWWFRAKRELVAEVLADAGVAGRVLDVGCGTGAVLRRLADAGHGPLVGTDLSPAALQAAHRGDHALVRSRAEALPFADRSAAALVSLDVVEHLDDDRAALAEYRRVVRPGGLVVVAVPAYQWAWSDHDVALGHRRRYVRPQLGAAADGAGLEVLHLTHFHSWLAPVAFAVRRSPLRRLVRGSDEEVSSFTPGVNRLLTRVGALERRWARRRRLPVGLSILLVARRPDRPPR